MSGIPAADQQLLFEPFHRGRNVGDIPGTGLGLALSKALDIHGGQITVASVVGVGTTFTITLPLGKLESISDLNRLASGQQETMKKILKMVSLTKNCTL